MSSIGIIANLQRNLLKDLDAENARNVQEDIQGLIDCITELHNERFLLSEKLEETTIDVGVQCSKYNSCKKKADEETAKAVCSAKQQNIDFVQELHRITDDIHMEVTVVDEKYRLLKRENETLLMKAEEAKRMWPQLCGMMCVSMEKKAQLQIEVNETRCKTIETHQRATALDEEAKDFILDIENYWKMFLIEVNKIKEEADEWRRKIKEQDEATGDAKSSLDAIQLEIRWSQARNKKAVDTLEREQNKYSNLKKQSSTLERKVASKVRQKEKFKGDIKSLHMQKHREKSAYEERIREITRLNENTLMEARGAHREKEIISIEKQTLKQLVEKKRFLLQNTKSRNIRKRNDLMEVNNEANMVMSNLATSRSDKMKLKERLVANGANREQMERRYAKELQKLTKDLEVQTMLKKEAKQNWLESLATVNRWNEQMLGFFERSNNLIDENKKRHFALQQEIELLSTEIEGLHIREAGLALRLSEQTRIMNNMKSELHQSLRVLTISIDKNQIFIETVTKEKEVLEPKYLSVLKLFEEKSSNYKAIRDSLVIKNRTMKEIGDDKIRCKRLIEELVAPRQQFKEELRVINDAILKQIQHGRSDLRCIGGKIYEVLKVSEILHDNNRTFHNRNKKMRRMVRRDNSEITSLKQAIQFYDVVYNDLRHELTNMMLEEVQITKVANIRDAIAKNQISAVKKMANTRANDLHGMWTKISDLLKEFSQFNSLGTRKAKKTSYNQIDTEQSSEMKENN